MELSGTSGLSFGVAAIQNRPWPEYLDAVRFAEDLGFERVWVADHFVNPYSPEQDWFEAWTVLGALAQATSRIRLGPLVTPVTLRNPALTARQTMTLDHVSAGRAEIGIGAGGAALDHSMTGVEPWGAQERVERLDEMLQIVRTLLDEQRLDHHGARYRIESAVVNPAPVQSPRPPLTVGALGPKTIELAAKHGDRWNSYPVTTGRRLSAGVLTGDDAFELMKARAASFDRHCAEHGRGHVERSLLTFFGYTEPVPAPGDMTRFTQRYREIGFTDFVLYLPGDAEGRDRLRALAEARRDGSL